MTMCTKTATHAIKTRLRAWVWQFVQCIGGVDCTVEQSCSRAHIAGANLKTVGVRFFSGRVEFHLFLVLPWPCTHTPRHNPPRKYYMTAFGFFVSVSAVWTVEKNRSAGVRIWPGRFRGSWSSVFLEKVDFQLFFSVQWPFPYPCGAPVFCSCLFWTPSKRWKVCL